MFIVFILILTAIGAYTGYLTRDKWKIGDWLINYHGGFVRRGLIGELIYLISSCTNINPGKIVAFLQIILYSIYILFSYLLLRSSKSILPYTILIFSPFIFTFQINDYRGGYRKEIIYFAILSFLVWCSNNISKKQFEKIFFTSLALYPLVILSHEMLAVFLPYLCIVYVTTINISKKQIYKVIFLIMPSIISFIFACYFSGADNHVTAILASLENLNYSISNGSSGAIGWLGKSTSDGFLGVRGFIEKHQYFTYYPLVIVLSVLAYMPVRERIIEVFKNKLALSLVFVSFIGSVVLFIIIFDWGRLIYIHLVSMFLLTFTLQSTIYCNNLSIETNIYSHSGFRHKIFISISILFTILYSFVWRIPHCCEPYKYIKVHDGIGLNYYYKENKWIFK